ncbi:MAG: PKD domain-containing protein [Acidobacteria bacterium]|nr:PKD domain-containing protein [Acidobacteriota bacterium]
MPPKAAFAVDVACADGLCRARTGEDLTFTDTSSGTVSRRSWDFDVAAGRRPSAATARHAWSSPGFYEVTLTVSGADHESTASRVFLVEAADPAGTCEPDGETICLRDSRYQVRATWRSPEGEVLPARVAHAGTNDSGLLWFHDAKNWEVLVKVLDGCALNGADWVFVASATTLGFDVEVTDTVTGEVREYGNEPGRQADAVTDVAAFQDSCRP